MGVLVGNDGGGVVTTDGMVGAPLIMGAKGANVCSERVGEGDDGSCWAMTSSG